MDIEKKEVDFLPAFKQIARTASAGIPIRKALNSIAKTTAKAIAAEGCTILVLSPNREYLTVIAAYGLSDTFLRKGALNVHKSLPEVIEGKIAYITDITNDKRAQYPEAAQMENIKSVIGIPILQNKEIIGELRAYTKEPRHFTSMEKGFLSYSANIVSLLLEKYELYQLLEGEKQINLTKIKKSGSKIPKLPPSLLQPANFSHPSEEKFTRLLNFYRIEWLYEPRSFPIAWNNGKVTEMFTPDFYLPELDLYIELTTMKQSLVTEKNRKIRLLKELYPDVNIKLLNKSDYFKLLAKYGYGPIDLEKVHGVDHVLFNHTQIQQRVRALAKQISIDYSGKKLVLIGVLKGVVCFLSDLMRNLSLPISIEFLGISYYGHDTDQTVKVTKDLDIDIKGIDVLMVEDIVDTGMTLNYILNYLSRKEPGSLRVCTLLDKKIRRLVDVPLHYVGFEIPDEFVVGYGLDYKGEYRNLPFIGVLKPEINEEI